MAFGGAAAAAAIAQAIKASGVVLHLNPDEFRKILMRVADPLVVTAKGGSGLFGIQYQYLISYKGLAFFTKSKMPLDLPSGTEVVVADQIWIPR
jgi:hypothetical protein